MIQDLLGIRITRYSNCCAGQSILKMPRTPAGFRLRADARTPGRAWRSGAASHRMREVRLAERRYCEPHSGDGVRGGAAPTLLKNIT